MLGTWYTRQQLSRCNKMKFTCINLLCLCLFLLLSSATTQIRKKEGMSLGEKYQYLAGLSRIKPIIRIDQGIFKDFVKASPRNYSMIIMFTAMAPQRQCMICRMASEEFQIVADSFKHSKEFSNKLFFGVVDFDEGTEVFNQMRLNTAPAFIHFPAKGKPKPSDTLDIQRVGFAAESIVKWIADRTDVQIRVSRPPKYAGGFITLLISAVVGTFLYVIRGTLDFSKFYEKSTWGSCAVVFTLVLISGQMWNHIRSPPFVHKTQNGVAYFHGSSQAQFIFESYVIAIINGLMVWGMLIIIEVTQRKMEIIAKRTLVIFGLLLVVVFFSIILNIFRSKAQGYPYSFLFK